MDSMASIIEELSNDSWTPSNKVVFPDSWGTSKKDVDDIPVLTDYKKSDKILGNEDVLTENQALKEENKKLKKERKDMTTKLLKVINPSSKTTLMSLHRDSVIGLFFDLCLINWDALERESCITLSEEAKKKDKSVLYYLTRSNDMHNQVISNIILYISTSSEEERFSDRAIIELYDACLKYGCFPLRQEIFLINKEGDSFVCVSYKFKMGYYYNLGLLAERPALPEVIRDKSKADGSLDACTPVLKLKDGSEYSRTYIRHKTRKQDDDSKIEDRDIMFQKTAMSRLLSECFASETAGLYVAEEFGICSDTRRREKQVMYDYGDDDE